MSQTLETARGQWVQITVSGADTPMETYCVRPDDVDPAQGKGPWPAVIVLMEIFGVNSHIRSVADRLAAAGYVAIAPNYYHRTTPNMELSYTEQDTVRGRKHKDQTTREGVLADIQATVSFLQADGSVSPKTAIGCIGFCFGGHVAHIAASLTPVVATAAFYAGGVATFSPGGGAPTATRSGEIHGEILCLFGEQDPLIPQADTLTVENALKAANVQHEVVRYPGVGHGFFCDQRADYNADAAADAWSRTLALFNRILK